MGELVKGLVKDWVEELMVRGSAGRKALKLLRASVTVRWIRVKWYAVTFATVGPILDIWDERRCAIDGGEGACMPLLFVQMSGESA